MDELVARLQTVERSYEGFVWGISAYAHKKESRIQAILQFLNDNPSANSADVIEFVSDQPDFFEDDSSIEQVS